MNTVDIHSLSIQNGERVTVKNATGILDNQEVVEYPIKPGNVMMYYPEANTLVPRKYDSKSRTPSFKSIEVKITKKIS